MAQTGRPGLSAQQRAEFWNRWRAGQSMSDIGRALGRDRSSIHYVVRCSGGIAPAMRRRSRQALTLVEREDISRGIVGDYSIRSIAELCSAITRSHQCGRQQIFVMQATQHRSGAHPEALPKLRTPIPNIVFEDFGPSFIGTAR